MTVETYRPFPKQQEFHRNPAKYRLFGGAAGPGKTKALLWEGIAQCLDVPGSDSLLLRRTFPELEMSFLKEWRDVPTKDMGITWNESKHLAVFPNKSTLRFGYCKHEKDVYQYQGAEFLFIGLDELTMFTLRQWQFLTSRNRCPIPDSFPCMAGATNPGNIGHAWVKALWIDHEPPAGLENPELYNPSEYAFISARLSDNPIYASDAAYRRALELLPSHLRRAFLDGDWAIFAGQYFDIFDQATMVEREETWELRPWNTRWISVDWGFEHPACTHWFALGDDGVTRTYRELHQNRLSPRELGSRIVESSQGERITNVYLSPDAFAHRTDELSIAEQIGDVLSAAGLPRPAPADDDRVGGWMLMYQMLEAGQWKIGSSCKELIRFLPIAVRDEKKVEDIAKFDASNGQGGDDAGDCARYGIKSKHGIGRKPKDVLAQEAVARLLPAEKLNPAAPDYTAIAMASAKAQENIKPKFQTVPVSMRRRRYGGGFNRQFVVR